MSEAAHKVGGRPGPRAGIELGPMPDGSAVLLDTTSGAAYAVNATAAEVWSLCNGLRSEADIAAALLERYEATPAEVTASVRALLAHLNELGVLEGERGTDDA